jgi:hypothetical protein
MTFYDIRIEPIKDMKFDEIKKIVANAFIQHGGLSVEGVQFLNVD